MFLKISYVYPERLPSKKARSVSVCQTALALSDLTDGKLITEKGFDQGYFAQQIGRIYPERLLVEISKKALNIRSNKIFNRNLKKEIQSGEHDIFYTRHIKTADFLLANKRPHQKVILEYHQIFYKSTSRSSEAKRAQLRKQEDAVLRGVDGIVYINKTLKSETEKDFYISPAKGCVIYNAVQQIDRENISTNHSPRELCYVGNFLDWKGVDLLIQSMTNLPDFQLNIYGQNPEQQLKKLKEAVQSLNLGDQITFHGRVEHRQVLEILCKKSCITVVPNKISTYSRYSTPLKLLEYMSTGNLVLAANTPTIQEMIWEYENGFLFKSGNVQDLIKKILEIDALPEDDKKEIIENGINYSHQFTWKNRAGQIYEFASSLYR
ncbi:MAG: glycosyltransferase family 4 protein [Lentisphaeria bacterium]|nr:glycosyltransferase family 4 protein [Lentisphaeria bacterium]